MYSANHVSAPPPTPVGQAQQPCTLVHRPSTASASAPAGPGHGHEPEAIPGMWRAKNSGRCGVRMHAGAPAKFNGMG